MASKLFRLPPSLVHPLTHSRTLCTCIEKLFKIKDRIKTTVGSNMAQQRHQFMIDYVRQFENEVGLTSYLLL